MAEWGRSKLGKESIFNVPGLEKLPEIFTISPEPSTLSSIEFKTALLNAVRAHVKNKFLETQNNSPNQYKKKSIVAPLPNSVRASLEIFKEDFDPKILPYIIKGMSSTGREKSKG